MCAYVKVSFVFIEGDQRGYSAEETQGLLFSFRMYLGAFSEQAECLNRSVFTIFQ